VVEAGCRDGWWPGNQVGNGTWDVSVVLRAGCFGFSSWRGRMAIRAIRRRRASERLAGTKSGRNLRTNPSRLKVNLKVGHYKGFGEKPALRSRIGVFRRGSKPRNQAFEAQGKPEGLAGAKDLRKQKAMLISGQARSDPYALQGCHSVRLL
jgi:hypothetical protein